MLLALDGPVTCRLLDDRYVYHGAGAVGRCLDIATGEVVSRACAPEAAPAERCEDLARVVDAVLRAADMRDEAGIRVMQISAGAAAETRVLDALARALRPLGYATVRADVALPDDVLARLLHRHLVLVGLESDWQRASVESPVRWIRSLTAASPRAHLFVRLSCRVVRGTRPTLMPVVRERAPAQAPIPCASQRYVQEGALDRAEAAVHGALAECALRGVEPPADVLIGRVEVLFRQGRFAEAAARAVHLPPSDPRASSWRALVIRRNVMNMLQSVSTLLERLQEADDEYTALRRGCCWVREQPSAEAAGIVACDGTRLIVGDGVGAADLRDPDVRASIGPEASGTGRTIASGASAVVTAPVRYAGATIGFAIVRGRRDAAEALGGAAAALASACAPALRARLDSLSLAAASHAQAPEILGRSPSIAALREAIAKAAATSFPVLVEGESGTGKELVARAVHRLSARRDRRFSAINCAALSDDLVEAELFGHTRGAFTGAVAPRAGLFEESHGSTLFLDEVAELSARAQAKLLRVIQEREVRRVGDHLTRSIDVRVVAATNSPLATAVKEGRFREDLRFRLAVVRLRVPPLRERIEDVPLLAQTFWRAVGAETGKRALLSPDALAALCRHRWPGNVRELQNVMASLAVAAPMRGRIGARHVQNVFASHDAAGPDGPPATLDDARDALDRRLIAASLARHGGRCSQAARELGISRQGLSKAMKRLGIVGVFGCV